MTRKRFLKLVRSIYPDRDTGEAFAVVGLRECGNYQTAWEKIQRHQQKRKEDAANEN